MDDGFKKSEAKRAAKAQAQDRADFVVEMSGGDNGRIGRFGLRSKRQQEQHRKARERDLFEQAAKIGAAYAKLYNATLQLLHDTRDAVYEAQLLTSAQLEQAEKALADTVQRASRTTEGLAVFRSVDGAVYDENGHKLDDDAVMSVLFVDGAPSWENYQQHRADLAVKRERFDRMNAHEARLDEIQARMEDKDNPLTMEEIHAFKEEISDIKADAHAITMPSLQTKSNPMPVKELPDLPLNTPTI